MQGVHGNEATKTVSCVAEEFAAGYLKVNCLIIYSMDKALCRTKEHMHR